jgi:hypothetical protein
MAGEPVACSRAATRDALRGRWGTTLRGGDRSHGPERSRTSKMRCWAGTADSHGWCAGESQAAFREGGCPEISEAISRRETPSASKVRSRRSIETSGSAASIFATRDWLDRTALARAAWVTRRLRRCRRSPSESLNRISMYSSSAAESPRNSPAVPTRQPLLSTFFRFASRMVVFPKPPDAGVDHFSWGVGRLLRKHFGNHDRITVDSVHDPPCRIGIDDAQLVAACTDGGHGPRMRHLKAFSALQPPQQETRLQSRRPGERRGLYLSVEPHERLVSRAQAVMICQF